MELIDISLALFDGCPSWPGDPPFESHRLRAIAQGARANVSAFRASAHVGTHVDAPWHGVESGTTVDELDLSIFVGPAVVVDIECAGHVSAEALAAALTGPAERLLLRTRNSRPGGALEKTGFAGEYCALTLDAAEWIAKQGIRLVGVDYYSVEPMDSDGGVHRRLLSAGAVLLEGLDLRCVEGGEYELIALPLRLKGLDGSPVRAVLRRP